MHIQKKNNARIRTTQKFKLGHLGHAVRISLCACKRQLGMLGVCVAQHIYGHTYARLLMVCTLTRVRCGEGAFMGFGLAFGAVGSGSDAEGWSTVTFGSIWVHSPSCTCSTSCGMVDMGSGTDQECQMTRPTVARLLRDMLPGCHSPRAPKIGHHFFAGTFWSEEEGKRA